MNIPPPRPGPQRVADGNPKISKKSTTKDAPQNFPDDVQPSRGGKNKRKRKKAPQDLPHDIETVVAAVERCRGNTKHEKV